MVLWFEIFQIVNVDVRQPELLDDLQLNRKHFVLGVILVFGRELQPGLGPFYVEVWWECDGLSCVIDLENLVNIEAYSYYVRLRARTWTSINMNSRKHNLRTSKAAALFNLSFKPLLSKNEQTDQHPAILSCFQHQKHKQKDEVPRLLMAMNGPGCWRVVESYYNLLADRPRTRCCRRRRTRWWGRGLTEPAATPTACYADSSVSLTGIDWRV